VDVNVSRQHWLPQTVEVDPAVCLFCGGLLAERGRSKEHVFGRWLLEHYAVASDTVRGRWVSGLDLRTTKDLREHTMEGLLAGRVCTPCNNGWMSQLEQDVRPLLLHLSTGSGQLDALTADERRLLARWAIKTAAALNHASNYHTVVTYKDAQACAEGSPVDHIAVLARLMPRVFDPLSWHQAFGSPVLVPSTRTTEEAIEAAKAAWRIVLVIGRLLLLVAHDPGGGWDTAFPVEFLYPVWPVGREWPAHEGGPPSVPGDDLPGQTFFTIMSLKMFAPEDRDHFGTLTA
jgi:hypothetical protein